MVVEFNSTYEISIPIRFMFNLRILLKDIVVYGV